MTLAFNAFKDSCLSLTKKQFASAISDCMGNSIRGASAEKKKQVELCKGFDYGDMEAQNDKTLAFNAFKDPCPSLTRSR